MSLLLRLPIALRLQVLLWTAGSCPYDGYTRGYLASPYGYPPLRAFVSLGYGIWHREFIRRSNWWAVSCSYVCLPLPAAPLTAPALMAATTAISSPIVLVSVSAIDGSVAATSAFVLGAVVYALADCAIGAVSFSVTGGAGETPTIAFATGAEAAAGIS